MLQPGEPFPAEASSSMVSLTAATTATPTPSSTSASAASATTTAAAAPTPSSAASNSSLSTGATVGIAVGSAAVALLLAALFFFVWRSKKLAKKVKYGEVKNSNGAQSVGGEPGRHGTPSMVSGLTSPGLPPTGPGGVITDGDTVFVPVKRSDLRQSHLSNAYSDVPPYEHMAVRTDEVGTPASRSTSPGYPGRYVQ
jgi:hypothetical protein